jgi:hypothetical protein
LEQSVGAAWLTFDVKTDHSQPSKLCWFGCLSKQVSLFLMAPPKNRANPDLQLLASFWEDPDKLRACNFQQHLRKMPSRGYATWLPYIIVPRFHPVTLRGHLSKFDKTSTRRREKHRNANLVCVRDDPHIESRHPGQKLSVKKSCRKFKVKVRSSITNTVRK